MFRLQILQVEYATPDEVDAIFSNITDIVELTMTLISSLEDTLEMAEEGQVKFKALESSNWIYTVSEDSCNNEVQILKSWKSNYKPKVHPSI